MQNLNHKKRANDVNGYSEQNSTELNWTLWPLVRERTIPTDRPPLVDEI
jgi:hypothetical protein